MTAPQRLSDWGVQCPYCERVYSPEQWSCLDWLQYSGVRRAGQVLRGFEVRRCLCALPIVHERDFPSADVTVARLISGAA